MLVQADAQHTEMPVLRFWWRSVFIWSHPSYSLGRRFSSHLASPENGSRVNHVTKVPMSCSHARDHYVLESQGSPSIYFDLLVKLCWSATGKPFVGLRMLWVRWKLSYIMRMQPEIPESYFLRMCEGAAAHCQSLVYAFSFIHQPREGSCCDHMQCSALSSLTPPALGAAAGTMTSCGPLRHIKACLKPEELECCCFPF